MKTSYDDYYQTADLFGEPYPELIDYYIELNRKGKLLDMGCGQGRDAVALARLGFEVTGIDISKVGIAQLNAIAEKEKLVLSGVVDDIYKFSNFDQFDFILLDSMFHFAKKDREREIDLINRIIVQSKDNALITICIQNAGKKLDTLNSIIANQASVEKVFQKQLIYQFEDKATNHRSDSLYEIISLLKIGNQKG